MSPGNIILLDVTMLLCCCCGLCPGPQFHMINTKQKAWPFKLSNCIHVLSWDNERGHRSMGYSVFQSILSTKTSFRTLPQIAFIKTDFYNQQIQHLNSNSSEFNYSIQHILLSRTSVNARLNLTFD